MRPSGKADERGPTSSRNERRVSDQLPAIGSFRFPRVAMLAFGRVEAVMTSICSAHSSHSPDPHDARTIEI
jgi:hypothetical protein